MDTGATLVVLNGGAAAPVAAPVAAPAPVAAALYSVRSFLFSYGVNYFSALPFCFFL